MIISDLVGYFSRSSMVKVRGQNLNRNTVKQTAEIGKKISGDNDADAIASLVPGVKNLRIRLGVIRLPRQVVYEMIPADQEHFESLAWPCRSDC